MWVAVNGLMMAGEPHRLGPPTGAEPWGWWQKDKDGQEGLCPPSPTQRPGSGQETPCGRPDFNYVHKL